MSENHKSTSFNNDPPSKPSTSPSPLQPPLQHINTAPKHRNNVNITPNCTIYDSSLPLNTTPHFPLTITTNPANLPSPLHFSLLSITTSAFLQPHPRLSLYNLFVTYLQPIRPGSLIPPHNPPVLKNYISPLPTASVLQLTTISL